MISKRNLLTTTASTANLVRREADIPHVEKGVFSDDKRTITFCHPLPFVLMLMFLQQGCFVRVFDNVENMEPANAQVS